MRTTIAMLVVCATAMGSPIEVSAEDYESNEDWVKEVRGSGSYQRGLQHVRDLMEKSYDIGALKGAAHWEDSRKYYIDVARAKGCKRGTPYSSGPVEVCKEITGPAPKITDQDYKTGMKQISKLASATLYPDMVERVLHSLYDYGYVQGMKHGIRAHNDEILFTQTYYRSCMERAAKAKGEKACATGSKEWADAEVARLRKELEAHGLPAGKVP